MELLKVEDNDFAKYNLIICFMKCRHSKSKMPMYIVEGYRFETKAILKDVEQLLALVENGAYMGDAK